MGLFILVQDVLHQPLGRISAETLCDLFALSETGEQLPKPLLKELDFFCRQKLREVQDLPDGKPMSSFLLGFKTLDPHMVPLRLRSTLESLDEGQSLSAEAAEILASLMARWRDVIPTPLQLPTRSTRNIEHPPTPDRLLAPDEVEKKKTRSESTPRSSRTPAAQKDARRVEWIREDALGRLVEYTDKGLKEPVIVGGIVHRSPFKDLTESEVLAELRAMKRDGLVNFSAGRWSMRRGARPMRTYRS